MNPTRDNLEIGATNTATTILNGTEANRNLSIGNSSGFREISFAK